MKKQLPFTVIFTAPLSPAIVRQKVSDNLVLDYIHSKTDMTSGPVSTG